jgi:hypothetical protein
MDSQKLKEMYPDGHPDPILDVMIGRQMALTAAMYMTMAYPDRSEEEIQELLTDPEEMSNLPDELRPEEEELTTLDEEEWQTAIDEVQEEHELAMELDKNPLIDNLPSLEKLNELLGEK